MIPQEILVFSTFVLIFYPCIMRFWICFLVSEQRCMNHAHFITINRNCRRAQVSKLSKAHPCRRLSDTDQARFLFVRSHASNIIRLTVNSKEKKGEQWRNEYAEKLILKLFIVRGYEIKLIIIAKVLVRLK